MIGLDVVHEVDLLGHILLHLWTWKTKGTSYQLPTLLTYNGRSGTEQQF